MTRHLKVPYGLCSHCGHYGDDCTGIKLETEVFIVELVIDARLPILERSDEARSRLMQVSGVKRVSQVTAQDEEALRKLDKVLAVFKDCGRLE